MEQRRLRDTGALDDQGGAYERRLALLVVERDAAVAVAELLDPTAVLEKIVDHAARIRPGPTSRAAVLELTGDDARVIVERGPAGRSDEAGVSTLALRTPQGIRSGATWASSWETGDLDAAGRTIAARAGVVQGAIAAIPGPDKLHLVLATGDSRPLTRNERRTLASLAFVARAALKNARAFQRIAALADTDELTGLPNRRRMDVLLAMPQERPLAILAIDVDNLKHINDRHGHVSGDRTLRSVAEAIASCLREGDAVARNGGDEFLAVLFGANAGDSLRIAERMRAAVRSRTPARISIGIAVGAPHRDLLGVRQAADRALYEAKAKGRDQVVTAGEHTASADDRLSAWAATLESVISGAGVFAVYQPIVRLADESIAGYSAVVRPAGGAAGMSVAGMFDAAQRLGVLRRLDWESRRAALAGATDLPPGVPLFIKTATATLLDPEGADAMCTLVEGYGRCPDNVVIEVAGSFYDQAPYLNAVEQHRACGFRFAVAGFGTGRLSLDGLMRLRPDFVKVSPVFLREADEEAIRELRAVAGDLPANLIADQLATPDDVSRAAAAGIELLQGFSLGRLSRHTRTRILA